MDIRQTNCPKRHKGALGGFRGSNIQKSRDAVKRLDRLAPTLVHVGGFIWEYKYKSPLNTPGGMAGGGGLEGHKFKSLGKLSNGWTDWHQIWYTSVDSSGNGHRLKTIHPTIPRSDILGGFMGSTIKNSGKCGQTAGPIGNKLCTCKMQMNLGKDTGWTNWPKRHQGEHFYVELSRGKFWGLIFHQKSGECHDIQRKQMKINFLKIKCTNRYNFAATITGEAR